MAGRRSTLLRLLKPIVAGIAVAYVVTAYVDKPAPVHFQPENPYASKQAEIAEPITDMVVEQNIMKLGSPLSARPSEFKPMENPLAGLENVPEQFPDNLGDNGTAAEPPIIRGDVSAPPEQ